MVSNVYGTTDRATGDSTHGQNTIVHYYDKAGVKAANASAVYAQFADRRSMPQKMGTTYKVSKWLHIYDRETTDGDFATLGYLTARNVIDVSAGLASDAALAEGAGAVNKQTIKKVTIETNLSRYGEMVDYTDEVEMFAEDMVQVHYREELGLLANRRSEDLIQLDMLTTTNVMYSGVATSIQSIGDEIPSDAAGVAGGDDDLARVSYDLIRKGVRKLIRNRAQKTTSIISGSTKVDTRTVNKAFYAIIGPEVKYDLESVIRGSVAVNGNTEYAFVPAHKYADASNLAEGEVGAMNDVRFIESESAMAYRGAGGLTPSTTVDGDGEYGAGGGALAVTTHDAITSAEMNTFIDTANGFSDFDGYSDAQERFDVFPILFPTKGSFATVGLKGRGKIKFNAQAPSKIELSNPYGTQGFFSYNMWYAGIILREERLLKILVAASA
ncbi:MAG: N4-gp56 family major capsid protein [Gammaproteobacteria bacterium]|nr:N4-gp56 family major capsid protein [Gammaproteobacteria bacterium]